MIYQKSSKHSPQEVEQSLREAVQRHKFGILHVLDLKNTLHDKGIDLDNEVRIYDVCNPLAASQALHQDMATATVLPCRIAGPLASACAMPSLGFFKITAQGLTPCRCLGGERTHLIFGEIARGFRPVSVQQFDSGVESLRKQARPA